MARLLSNTSLVADLRSGHHEPMTFGDLTWARSTGGRLAGWTRVHQTGLLIGARLAASRTGRHTKPTDAALARLESTLADLAPPDTAIVRECRELIAEHESPALLGHTWRTYAFGRLFAALTDLTPDPEAFAVAALLHDLALGRRDHDLRCFAHDGAEQALTLIGTDRPDWPADRARLVADAICLHLRVTVPVESGVEAHLVNAGAAIDVAGSRLAELPRPVVTEVLRRHPRLDVADELCARFGDELSHHPGSRVAVWMGLGFAGVIRANQLGRNDV
jgi:hypothetical protein